ncbi:probable alpha-mannosidase At5g13980 [Papaver somniferum]|uniref:probable alpha-mannosidase At5g13980 n=1 Tax=Papaver somniferum TaxID=3469 RepID=UPI000E6F4D6B|nr:probable alpha-mannosidase At5g13980 [Papaver somniferum]
MNDRIVMLEEMSSKCVCDEVSHSHRSSPVESNNQGSTSRVVPCNEKASTTPTTTHVSRPNEAQVPEKFTSYKLLSWYKDGEGVVNVYFSRSGKTFYTDSNGRDFIKRVRDYGADWDLQVNQHIAGNYYQISIGVHVEDDKTELSVLVDRSVGGSSLMDGQVEMMIRRRLVYDDSRGVAEALNETFCVADKCIGLIIQGNFYLRIDPVGEGAKWRRSSGQEIYSPFLLAFTEQDGDNWRSSHVTSFSGMDPSYSLPDNVAMLTLLEGHSQTIFFNLPKHQKQKSY